MEALDLETTPRLRIKLQTSLRQYKAASLLSNSLPKSRRDVHPRKGHPVPSLQKPWQTLPHSCDFLLAVSSRGHVSHLLPALQGDSVYPFAPHFYLLSETEQWSLEGHSQSCDTIENEVFLSLIGNFMTKREKRKSKEQDAARPTHAEGHGFSLAGPTDSRSLN